MGIRMVLGATRSDVQLLVLRQGLVPVAGGLLLGLALARVAGGLLESFLFGVRPWDPLAFAAVTIIVLVATAAGCYLPALRATKVDPIVSLRCA